ncbi:MAG: DUF1566 domain-containing protein [Myxococcota bacterium]
MKHKRAIRWALRAIAGVLVCAVTAPAEAIPIHKETLPQGDGTYGPRLHVDQAGTLLEDGNCVLDFDADGNLVLLEAGVLRWSSLTAGATTLGFDETGQLTIYGELDDERWSSRSLGGHTLDLVDCRAEVRNAVGELIWAEPGSFLDRTHEGAAETVWDPGDGETILSTTPTLVADSGSDEILVTDSNDTLRSTSGTMTDPTFTVRPGHLTSGASYEWRPLHYEHNTHPGYPEMTSSGGVPPSWVSFTDLPAVQFAVSSETQSPQTFIIDPSVANTGSPHGLYTRFWPHFELDPEIELPEDAIVPEPGSETVPVNIPLDTRDFNAGVCIESSRCNTWSFGQCTRWDILKVRSCDVSLRLELSQDAEEDAKAANAAAYNMEGSSVASAFEMLLSPDQAKPGSDGFVFSTVGEDRISLGFPLKDAFGMRSLGYLQVPASGYYTFGSLSGGGVEATIYEPTQDSLGSTTVTAPNAWAGPETRCVAVGNQLKFKNEKTKTIANDQYNRIYDFEYTNEDETWYIPSDAQFDQVFEAMNECQLGQSVRWGAPIYLSAGKRYPIDVQAWLGVYPGLIGLYVTSATLTPRALPFEWLTPASPDVEDFEREGEPHGKLGREVVAVAISGRGNDLVAMDPDGSLFAYEPGIFGDWKQVATLTPPSGSFGISTASVAPLVMVADQALAIDDDGNTLVAAVDPLGEAERDIFIFTKRDKSGAFSDDNVDVVSVNELLQQGGYALPSGENSAYPQAVQIDPDGNTIAIQQSTSAGLRIDVIDRVASASAWMVIGSFPVAASNARPANGYTYTMHTAQGVYMQIDNDAKQPATPFAIMRSGSNRYLAIPGPSETSEVVVHRRGAFGSWVEEVRIPVSTPVTSMAFDYFKEHLAIGEGIAGLVQIVRRVYSDWQVVEVLDRSSEDGFFGSTVRYARGLLGIGADGMLEADCTQNGVVGSPTGPWDYCDGGNPDQCWARRWECTPETKAENYPFTEASLFLYRDYYLDWSDYRGWSELKPDSPRGPRASFAFGGGATTPSLVLAGHQNRGPTPGRDDPDFFAGLPAEAVPLDRHQLTVVATADAVHVGHPVHTTCFGSCDYYIPEDKEVLLATASGSVAAFNGCATGLQSTCTVTVREPTTVVVDQFGDNLDGTVADATRPTLMWSRASFPGNWYAGMSHTSEAGYDDWRLPTQEELRRLYPLSSAFDPIDAEGFRKYHWTRDEASNPSYIKVVNFTNGGTPTLARNSAASYRLVRDAAPDGTVIVAEDPSLMWTQKAFNGNWSKAMSHTSEVGFDDWRLPSQEELLLLYPLDDAFDPIDTGGHRIYHWTHEEASNPSFAKVVNFTNGGTPTLTKLSNAAYRLVRNAWEP